MESPAMGVFLLFALIAIPINLWLAYWFAYWIVRGIKAAWKEGDPNSYRDPNWRSLEELDRIWKGGGK